MELMVEILELVTAGLLLMGLGRPSKKTQRREFLAKVTGEANQNWVKGVSDDP